MEEFASCLTKDRIDALLNDVKEVAELKDENSRLQYRCGILEQALKAQLSSSAEASSPSTNCSNDPRMDWSHFLDEYKSVVEYIKFQFSSSLRRTYASVNVPIVITEATKHAFGDYQFNGAMSVAQQLSKAGQKISPRSIAENIVSQIHIDERLISKLEVSGPGFVNIHLNKDAVSEYVKQSYINGLKGPKIRKRRAVVDFSSPNIAKEMHVGHLRSTVIGDSICRLLEYEGFDVLRINHIGDWGTQFGMLICNLQDRFPNYLHESPPLSELQHLYKESKLRFDSDEEFKKRAHLCVVRLQNGDPDFIKAWKLICDVSRKDFAKIYKRLDIKIEEKGESFYQERMHNIVMMMEEKGLLTEDEGRKIVFPEGFNVPLTVVKKDGSYTYDTSDLATLQYRIFEQQGEWILYVVDAGQSFHLQQIYQMGRQMGWYDPEKIRVEHVQFGVVLGEDRKKFKTRSGETVKLNDLLDESLRRSLAKLKEKNREDVLSPEELQLAQEAIAYGCIKYADLSRNRSNDYVFSFDKVII
ncbi:unnamed protein product [Soboliphyme baturini]|uniref:Probable arginine--tRNA ligase, cytoplasmic n=1 Tax=Soboliphyme baturini TaxID=241478 RepID=A0A183J479_9BILA|nr:unnamed protein product [Soboliphyme baturini]